MFQLVLQFSPWGLGVSSFDELAALEHRLAEALRDEAEVDGHDMGSDEANIFIWSAAPLATLGRCVPIIDEAGLLNVLSAGHRAPDGNTYTRVWPRGDASCFEVK